jgi:hypothetical protein
MATGAKNLTKPVKIALKKRDTFPQSQEELLKWIKHLIRAPHTESWRALDRAPELSGQCFVEKCMSSCRSRQVNKLVPLVTRRQANPRYVMPPYNCPVSPAQ